ncbi:MAG: hypothetical protein R3B47_16010 [Bacteroidia bacterium]
MGLIDDFLGIVKKEAAKIEQAVDTTVEGVWGFVQNKVDDNKLDTKALVAEANRIINDYKDLFIALAEIIDKDKLANEMKLIAESVTKVPGVSGGSSSGGDSGFSASTIGEDGGIGGIEERNRPTAEKAAAAIEESKLINGVLAWTISCAAEIDVLVGGAAGVGLGVRMKKDQSQNTKGTRWFLSAELDIGAQIGVTGGGGFGFWSMVPEDMSGNIQFISVSAAYYAGLAINLYFKPDATLSVLQGFSISPILGKRAEFAFGESYTYLLPTSDDKVTLGVGEGYISFTCKSGFVVKVELWYTTADGTKEYFKKRLSVGFQFNHILPYGSTDVRFLVKTIGIIKERRLDHRFDSVFGLRKYYQSHGTIFKPVIKEVST